MSEAQNIASPDNDDDQPVAKQTIWSKLSFVGFMLALTVLFVYLGFWQVSRLAEKERLIAAVEQRVGDAPIALPPLAEWVGFDAQTYDFRPLKISGTFDHKQTILVFTSLVDGRGIHGGPGYWVVAPFFLNEGGTVFVNRGFVPEANADQFKQGGAGPEGLITISGLGRISEEPNTFTPGSDFSGRIEWVRNIDRMLMFIEEDLGPVAPIYINADATVPGALPQGGETRITFTNRHLEYALTWFSLSVLTPILLLFWLWRGRKSDETA